ncbi:hypothetical protein QJS04_geneDACA016038 [Acorus gramineus]|uniref:Uncharacterized protein n=1 Tax=Acorus gramineus TaxID=55184 RepID=A0AAV9BH29_ACOGR|nr:hypothetical protein QJS04_geneDACA016038 [Acorus gramineus]
MMRSPSPSASSASSSGRSPRSLRSSPTSTPSPAPASLSPSSSPGWSEMFSTWWVAFLNQPRPMRTTRIPRNTCHHMRRWRRRRSPPLSGSARSLARSGTPPYGSYLGVAAKSGPSVLSRPNDDSSSEEEESPIYSRKPQPKPKPKPKLLSRSVDYGAFIAAAVNLPFQSNAFIEGQTILSGRKFLQDHQLTTSTYGMWLGWMMAAIYMGGRIPQIWLNIKRGSVEGLNPLMFVLALLANATYVGSILVRSVEWKRIKANVPWLLDAIVCVALDLFIILQFAYYKSRQRRMSRCRNDNENVLFEAEKALLS